MNAASIAASVQTRAPRGAFVNDAICRFSRAGKCAGHAVALDRVQTELGREYELIIGGRCHKTDAKIRSSEPRAS